MKLEISTTDGRDTVSVHHIFMLSGRLDWTDHGGKRTRGPVPHEFSIEGATDDGLYVRIDWSDRTCAGYADEVRLNRDFFGKPELTIDGVMVQPDAGFSLYVSRRFRGATLPHVWSAEPAA